MSGCASSASCATEQVGPAAQRTGERIRLRDGRWLGYAEYGDPEGVPLFVFHGTPGSRLMVEAADRPARRRGVRLIAPDRPGFGLSTRQVGRRLADWPKDVVALADALGIGRFGVIGVSGGGPYAIACAWCLPSRLTVAAVVSGVGPISGPGGMPGLDRWHRALLEVARRFPGLGYPLFALGAFAWRRFPKRMLQQLRNLASEVDRAVLARPEVVASLSAGVPEAFRETTRGLADELHLFARPWDFPIEQTAMSVHLWHGERDWLVPVAAAQHLARRLPDCTLRIVPGAGHYLIYDMIDELLDLAAPT